MNASQWIATHLRGDLTDGEVIATSAIAGFGGSLIGVGFVLLLRWVTPRVVG